MQHGLGLLWKPEGPTSNYFLRDFTKSLSDATTSKVPIKNSKVPAGHAGTLDPFASGLMLCGFGEGTKLLAPLTGLDKSYEAHMCLGLTSNTLDITGELRSDSKDLRKTLEPKEEALSKFLEAFSNTKLMQLPPQVSALHVNGKRAYEWAREGVEVDLKKREITIKSAKHLGLFQKEILGEKYWIWHFLVSVTSGTYIRALARDWAQELFGLSGLLVNLKRLSIGPLQVSENKAPLWLDAQDLKPLFNLVLLDELAAHKLRDFGILGADLKLEGDVEKPTLLLGPRSTGTVAWMPPNSRKLGRVFLADPFQMKA